MKIIRWIKEQMKNDKVWPLKIKENHEKINKIIWNNQDNKQRILLKIFFLKLKFKSIWFSIYDYVFKSSVLYFISIMREC